MFRPSAGVFKGGSLPARTLASVRAEINRGKRLLALSFELMRSPPLPSRLQVLLRRLLL